MPDHPETAPAPATGAPQARTPASEPRVVRAWSWGLLPMVAVCAAAVALFVLLDRPLGYALLVVGAAGGWLTDRLRASDGLGADLTCIAAGLGIIGLIPLKADISWPMFAAFGVVLTAAVVVPWWLSHKAFKVEAIVFPLGGWRWNRAQWTYLIGVLSVAFFLLPFYFLSTGVYANWPAVHEPSEVARLFVGVNAVGLWDELFFICTVFALFRRHVPMWLANLLQATIFVSFLWELGYRSWGPLLTIPFALIQGFIFQLTKNLFYVVTLHLLFDVIVFAVILHGHNPAWPHPFFFLT